MMTLIILAVIFLILGLSFYLRKKESKKQIGCKESLNQALQALSDFEITTSYINDSFFLAVDEKNKKFSFKKIDSEVMIFDFKDALFCEVLENGETTFRKVNALGRALMGGILVGGVGAIVGGSSANEKEVKTISTLKLKIGLKSISNPSYEFCFFDSNSHPHYVQKGFKLNSHVLVEPMADIQKWKDTFTAIVSIGETSD